MGEPRQSFSSPWGWVKFALEPAFGGNRRGGLFFFRLVSPVEGGWCAGTSPRLIRCTHARVSTETRSLLHGPHHHHP